MGVIGFVFALFSNDMTLTPDPVSTRYGFGIFDYPKALFLIDFGLLLGSLIYYAATAVPDNRRLQTKKLLTLVALFVGMQALFSFVEIPGRQARWVHAPLFLLQILGAVGALDAIERRGDEVLGTVERKVKRAVEEAKVEKLYDGRKGGYTEKYWKLNEIPLEI
ncbi:hypothetical protein BDD12DRAFT_829802 [Trichophaea hybrida]|nr:hypothetical protein BDD12DRAFT_829802 [Trichophaea hybrida]